MAKAKPKAVEEVEVQAVARKEKRVIDRDQLVTIMNNTTGRVVYKSKKTGQEWVFSEYGETDEMDVGELVSMKNAYPRYLKEPWLVILDAEIVTYLGLDDVYETILSPEEVDNFFDLSVDKMEQYLRKANEGMRQLVVSLAMKKIQDKTFDSVSKIRLIEDVYGIELTVK